MTFNDVLCGLFQPPLLHVQLYDISVPYAFLPSPYASSPSRAAADPHCKGRIQREYGPCHSGVEALDRAEDEATGGGHVPALGDASEWMNRSIVGCDRGGGDAMDRTEGDYDEYPRVVWCNIHQWCRSSIGYGHDYGRDWSRDDGGRARRRPR